MPWRRKLPVKCLYMSLCYIYFLISCIFFLWFTIWFFLFGLFLSYLFRSWLVLFFFFFSCPSLFRFFLSTKWRHSSRGLSVTVDKFGCTYEHKNQYPNDFVYIPNPKINLVSKDQVPCQPHSPPKSPALSSLSFDSSWIFNSIHSPQKKKKGAWQSLNSEEDRQLQTPL